jgi:hypothetical protein
MKIVRHPFHASIVPQAQLSSELQALWHCVIRRDGSPEVLVRHDARRKEDAACVARLELVRLERTLATPAARRA